MTSAAPLFRRHAGRLAAVAIVVLVYGMTRLPSLADAERSTISARFGFDRFALPEVPGPAPRTIRAVHPDYRDFAGWISVVGAAASLQDLDGDGLANDCCHVDPRTDQVIVAPLPETGRRFSPFVLEASGPPDARGERPTAPVAPMGCLGGDFNEDGLTDLLVYYWGRPPVAFLRRTPAPGETPGLSSSAFAGVAIAPASERWYTNAVTSADIDGDGHLDLFIGNYFPDGARVLDPSATNREEMQDSMSRAFNGGTDRVLLFRGATAGADPTVAYDDVDVLETPVGAGWTLAVAAADLDGDLLPEIYLANDFGPDRLLHNRSEPGAARFAVVTGRKTLTTPTSKALGRDSFKGMGVDFGDVNADGHLDIYVSNIAEEYALEESHFLFVSTGDPDAMRDGVAPYHDRSEPLGVARTGWSWDAKFGDFDNDGVPEMVQATGFVQGSVNRWPELHELAMANDEMVRRTGSWPRLVGGDDLSGWLPNAFFVRAESGRYFDVAGDIGLGEPHVSRGIATGDVDGDGDLDMVIANQWEPSYFFRNEGGARGAFLSLDLRLPLGSGASRPAIGATAIVTLPGGRTLTAQVDGGNGHSGARSPQLHFGLGAVDAATPLDVEVRSRDARGAVRSDALRLTPGHHAVTLGAGGRG